MQHLFTIIACIFLRLSKVRIMPRATDHSKKTTLKRAQVWHALFQEKQLPSDPAKELKKDLTLNKPLLEETHQSLSSLPLLTKTVWNTWKKEAKTSTSQSCASLEKLMFHWLEPLRNSKFSATEAFFARAIPNKERKASLRTESLHHRSCQNLVLALSPTLNLENPENVSHPILIFFHNPTPKAPTGSREHHPPDKLPKLESTATLHQASLSIP
jgi:hypothetical protein